MIMSIRRKISGKVRSFVITTAGVAAIEFAMIAPILLVMMFGTLEVGRAIVVHKRFQRATAMVGDLITRETSVTSVDMAGIVRAAEHVISPYDVSTFRVAVHSIDIPQSNSPSGTVLWSYAHNGMSTQSCGGQKDLPATGMVTAGNTGIMVETDYQYTPMFEDFLPVISAAKTFGDTIVNAPRDKRSVDFDPVQC